MSETGCKNHAATLCWECSKAVGGCSWSKKGDPVAGWTAEPTTLRGCGSDPKPIHSFRVLKCPLFVADSDENGNRIEKKAGG